ncbi:RNA pseudouridine synthase [Pontixanthobacter aestiaquae]|uniref:RNA pseudouridine synthase n=1 Tax=Pontixanthobacter aestiaquae TaxID=1509367 RepID=A0A844Z0S1_9SPHN|nr:RNA pseudouridine synthase [Pontixanthobacter aestiaquae]MDN3646696.1 RNA pseudouridine synthase [Pontixanthobacter aestiaquae]MXO82321.1 RNA pseudouridine synthase [Pontixanthobacter aestiaquae]
MNTAPIIARIPIVYEDGEALVIDKPAGLPVDPPRNGGTCLEDYFDGLRLGFKRRPIAVHRLDTDTSGCLLLARNPKAVKRFAQAFQDRLVGKIYLGIIGGVPSDSEGTIDFPLGKISSAEKGWRMVRDEGGKPSVTHWKVLKTIGENTLVEFRPETGRTHQIRVHAESGLGMPLIGDPVYGPEHGKSIGAKRTMLHASAITVQRDNKPEIAGIAPMPDDFVALGFSDG